MRKGYYPMDYTDKEWKEYLNSQRLFNKDVIQILVMLGSAAVLAMVLLLSGVLNSTM